MEIARLQLNCYNNTDTQHCILPYHERVFAHHHHLHTPHQPPLRVKGGEGSAQRGGVSLVAKLGSELCRAGGVAENLDV
jgi:hypothetical protein